METDIEVWVSFVDIVACLIIIQIGLWLTGESVPGFSFTGWMVYGCTNWVLRVSSAGREQ